MGRRFFLHEKDTFPPLDKRNTHDKAKGLRITSERYIGGWAYDALALQIEGRIRSNSHL